MWVFSYGSLMGDGWEKRFECQRRSIADLKGYERSFTKASIRNWGSRVHPAPTLRIIRREVGICRGVAFEFPQGQKEHVTEYLKGREGKLFTQVSVPMVLNDGEHANAITFIYEGKNIIAASNVDEIASLARRSEGTDGTGLDYIKSVRKTLADEDIQDIAVESLWSAIADVQ